MRLSMHPRYKILVWNEAVKEWIRVGTTDCPAMAELKARGHRPAPVRIIPVQKFISPQIPQVKLVEPLTPELIQQIKDSVITVDSVAS
jgi:hypothetical protein